MSQWRLGLTGGIGSGKSTVANLFAQLGIVLVDADLIARLVVAPGQPALAALAQHFGQELLNSQGELDRAALRARVFNQPDEKQWLEALLHPLIRAEMVRQSDAANSPYVIWVVPLLFEQGLRSQVHRSLVVDASEATQVERATRRDGSDPALIRQIMAAQLPRETRLALADDVLDNDKSDLQALHHAVMQLHRNYLHLATQQAG
ncbi:MAG: dephospho-CoA kinase [Aeromonadaceae bacterium]